MINKENLELTLLFGIIIHIFAIFFILLYQLGKEKCSSCKKLKIPRQMYSEELCKQCKDKYWGF